MKLKSFYRAAAVCAIATGLTFVATGPAAADPAAATTVAGAGSDTTQDVLDALAKSIGEPLMGSWNAIGGAALITPKNTTGCTNVSRPNGSSAGVAALRRSLSGTGSYPTTSATYAGTNPVPLGALCFDFARSSSGPGGNASPTGLLQYVPFGLDGVTVAVGPSSGADATAIRGSFTLTQLRTMYSQGLPQVGSDGATYDPNPADGTTGTAVHLKIPQAGSGTRSFFSSVMGISSSNPPTWVSDMFTPTAGGTAQSVQEHDGTAVRLDHNALMPYSTAVWIAQATGHNDRRDGAVLQTINGVAPISGGKLNTAFPGDLLREVYNVIPFAATTPGSNLYDIFVSTSQFSPVRLCNKTALITEYGFGLLDGVNTPHTCGEIDSALRAFDSTQF
ncbi:hypothetical protein ACN27F_17040 [Solwaraspora sp. WMMB335]|uniref:hypothetical protein n=1 Tax=Solwaraspora sp. WMMB335 TaxID=3404118 RepID=UPI003B92B836